MDDTTPQLRLEGTVTANGEAAQVYFQKEYTQQLAFPLTPGQEFVSLLVPQRAVVLLPGTADLSLPFDVTVRPPEQYQTHIEPGDDAGGQYSGATTEQEYRSSPDVDANPGGEPR